MAVNLFDANFYRAANSDLSSFDDAQALSHFQNYGLVEGRRFSPFVNLNFYRSSNSDLASLSNRQAFEHLQNYGVAEGRRFSEFADLNFYRASNVDLTSFNNEQIFQHLQSNGVNEGRSFSQFFNSNYYQASNPLIATGLSNKLLLQHFEFVGLGQGRLFSVPFDINYYRSVNPDLARASLSNQQLFEHFQSYGLREGRASSPFFNVSYYLNSNSDLKAAGFNNQQAYEHFVSYGLQEGRPGSQSPGGDYAGNVLTTARRIELAKNTFRDFVGSNDTEDFYHFNLNTTSDFNLLLHGLNADAEVELIWDFNRNQVFESNEVIAFSDNDGTTAESISMTLSEGTYYIHVYPYNSNTTYNLTLAAPTSAPPEQKTIHDIGTLSSTRTFSGFLGSDRSGNFYRFNLNNTANTTVVLDGLRANAVVDLIQDSNNNGVFEIDEIIDSSFRQEGTKAKSFSRTLAAGTYYIEVKPYSSNETPYNLTLSPLSSTPLLLSTARNIGSLNGTRTFSDLVGPNQTDDLYRFNLSTSSNTTVSLNGLNADADIELIQDLNNNGLIENTEVIASSANQGTTAEAIGKTLAAGTYYLNVSLFQGADTNYNLMLSAVVA